MALSAITDEPVPVCAKKAPWVPIELDLIVQEMLQKDPDTRMENLAEVESTINTYLMRTGGPVSAGEVASTIDLLFDTEDRSPLTEHSAKLTGSFPSETGSMSLASAIHTSSMAPTRATFRERRCSSRPRRRPDTLSAKDKKKRKKKKKKPPDQDLGGGRDLLSTHQRCSGLVPVLQLNARRPMCGAQTSGSRTLDTKTGLGATTGCATGRT